jgi:hypothetical protein
MKNLYKIDIFFFFWLMYKLMFRTFGKTPSFYDNLLYKWKVLCNKLAKGIESLIFKGFDIVFECGFIVRKWFVILIIHKK